MTAHCYSLLHKIYKSKQRHTLMIGYFLLILLQFTFALLQFNLSLQAQQLLTKYRSTVFACDISGDTRYVRCDFPHCSQHGSNVHGLYTAYNFAFEIVQVCWIQRRFTKKGTNSVLERTYLCMQFCHLYYYRIQGLDKVQFAWLYNSRLQYGNLP